jgi:hypothetical protein
VEAHMYDVCVLVQCENVLVMRSLRDGHGTVLLFVRGCRCEDHNRSVDVASTSVWDGSCAEHAACRSRAQCGAVQ